MNTTTKTTMPSTAPLDETGARSVAMPESRDAEWIGRPLSRLESAAWTFVCRSDDEVTTAEREPIKQNLDKAGIAIVIAWAIVDYALRGRAKHRRTAVRMARALVRQQERVDVAWALHKRAEVVASDVYAKAGFTVDVTLRELAVAIAAPGGFYRIEDRPSRTWTDPDGLAYFGVTRIGTPDEIRTGLGKLLAQHALRARGDSGLPNSVHWPIVRAAAAMLEVRDACARLRGSVAS